MLVLLPPSETKRFGGRQLFSLSNLSYATRLEATRERVRDALIAVSRDEQSAVKALKLGVKNRDLREHNLQLETSGASAAIERYTGVLYDALDVESLTDLEREWVHQHVAIQSALFGLCSASDEIPAYRLSASSRLPEIGSALAKLWAPAHAGLLDGRPYVLDLRSKDYAALAPVKDLGASSNDFLEVVTRDGSGAVRALNHFNKAAKGDLVRRLALSSPSIGNREQLLDWALEHDLELTIGDDPHTLRLTTTQGAPAVSR
ncbi:YaaA family protein [Leucobacter denitrificans]|uniref:Peroxide stress protein YaaA n=1 Tax=Leucobacter denitrificans TaxID=683042 RepID=A0A7G9S4H9_9MICO|nr:peroxide stress protein YaaA [Leucobacter denitrificans]QNN62754.1 peroxide stress protein YaaA [Leucobacter denitrificans]